MKYQVPASSVPSSLGVLSCIKLEVLRRSSIERNGGSGFAPSICRSGSRLPGLVQLLLTFVLFSHSALADKIPARVDRVTSSRVEISWVGLTNHSSVKVFLAAEPATQSGAPLPGGVMAREISSETNRAIIGNLAAGTEIFLRLETTGRLPNLTNDLHLRTLGGPRANLDTPLREISAVAPNILQVTIHNPEVDYNSGLGVKGNHGVAWQGGTWTVQRGNGSVIPVLAVHRHSVPTGQPRYTLGYPPDWRLENHDIVDVDHQLFLVLAEPILSSTSYEFLEISHGGSPETELRFYFLFSDRYSETPVLQVNQVGYNPAAEFRWAYVSGWMGDGGGINLDGFPSTASVLRESTDPMQSRQNILTSLPIERRSDFDVETGAPVKQIDLGGLPSQDGVRYRIRIPGVGVSWPTSVSSLAPMKAFYVSVRGLYHNRWGRELIPRSTDWHTRPADHPKVYTGEKKAEGFYDEKTPRKGLRPMRGGHHDAGDFDLRPMHMVIPQLLLRAYELSPSKFTDGQLDIPESGNGIPDLIDEALWNLQSWMQLQESDGGIRAGVESWRHPWGYYFADEEPFEQMPYWTYARDPDVTARASAVMAIASRLLEPFHSPLADDLKKAAIKGWKYATSKNISPAPELFLSSELFLLTGDVRYKEAFENVLESDFLQDWDNNGLDPGDGFKNILRRDLQKTEYEKPHVQAMTDYALGYIKQPTADPIIVNLLRIHIREQALASLSSATSMHAHRNVHGDIYDWGNSTTMGKHIMAVFTDLLLTPSPEVRQTYLNIISLSADHILGGNPAGMVWTTGLGSRSPQEPLHLDSLAFIKHGRKPIPGIPIYGPINSVPGDSYYRPGLSVFYPSFENLPLMRTFADTRNFVRTSEFTSWETMAPNVLLYAALLTGNTTRPESWKPGRPGHASSHADLHYHHPADIWSKDGILTTEEITEFVESWRAGGTWAEGPARIPIHLVTRAATIWDKGGAYIHDPSNGSFPLDLVPLGDIFDSSAFSPANGVRRELPAEHLLGVPFEVVLEATAAGTTAWCVEEQVPNGWVAKEISHGGAFDPIQSRVKWGPFFEVGTVELTYTVQGPSSSGGQFNFHGYGSFDGVNSEIGGSTSTISTSTYDQEDLLVVEGQGTVSPNLNNQSLELGKSYKLTAKPLPGHLFSHWSGSIESRSASIKVQMQYGLNLVAHFRPNPFLSRDGQYHGLIYQEESVYHDSSGSIRATINDRGQFSAKILMGSRRLSARGSLDLDGYSSVDLKAKDGVSLTLTLQLDLTSTTNQLAGYISGGANSTSLQAFRSFYDGKQNIAPMSGRYTALIPGSDEIIQAPFGNGYGTAYLDTKGRILWKGSLADGSKVAQRVPVSRQGLWPLYWPLYKNQGAVLGWVDLGSAQASETFQNSLVWIKLPGAPSKTYPSGFNLETEIIGSHYVPPNSSEIPLLGFSQGSLLLNGNNLPSPFQTTIAQDGWQFVSSSPDFPVRLKVKVKSGEFSGQIHDAQSGEKLKLNGVIMQNQNLASGYFLRLGESGIVLLGPRD